MWSKHIAAILLLSSIYSAERYATMTWPDVSADIWLKFSLLFGASALLLLYRAELLRFTKELKAGRIGNIGFFIQFPSKTRLVFVMKMLPIRLVKPVPLEANFRSGPSTGSAMLNVRKPPFHRRILYKTRGLFRLSPIPPKERKK